MKNTQLLVKESLPFDSNITNHIQEVVDSLHELKATRNYQTKFTKINMIGDGPNGVVLVQEKHGMKFCHFFTKADIAPVIVRNPNRIENIKPEKNLEICTTFNRRFARLLEYLDSDKVLCFLRLDKEPDPEWETELRKLTATLRGFSNPNQYLLYVNRAIDSSMCGVFADTYDIPVFLWNQEFEGDFCKTYDNRFLTLLSVVKQAVQDRIHSASSKHDKSVPPA